MSNTVLRLSDITMQFGGVVAVNNLSLEVNEGEIVAIIGPNGAGKTTAFNVITGVYAPTNGAVSFHGDTIISNFPQGKMKKLHAGEHRSDYQTQVRRTPDVITTMLDYKEEREMWHRSMELLEILGLADTEDEIARSLPYGKQRRLEIARALATNPGLLLLDEPAAGMNPQETNELTAFIRRLKDEFFISPCS